MWRHRAGRADSVQRTKLAEPRALTVTRIGSGLGMCSSGNICPANQDRHERGLAPLGRRGKKRRLVVVSRWRLPRFSMSCGLRLYIRGYADGAASAGSR